MLLLGLIFFAFLFWLDFGEFSVLSGDDLRCFALLEKGAAAYNEALAAVFKFRPITTLFLEAARLASNGLSGLILFSAALQSINGAILYFLMRRVFHATELISIALAGLAIFNRFSSYAVTPELGIMEGIAILFFLMFAACLFSLLESPTKTKALLTGVVFLIIIHVHERYFVLIGSCLVVSVLIYGRNKSAAVLVFVSAAASIGANLAIKRLILHIPIFVGTERRAIEFDPTQVLQFFSDGLLNFAGINRGPSYLSFLTYNESPEWLRIVSVISAVLISFFLIIAFFNLISSSEGPLAERTLKWGPFLLAITLVVTLVVSASITFRQEYRWLHAGFISFIILVGLLHNSFSNRKKLKRIATIAILGFLLVSLLREIGIRNGRDNYYGRVACKTASQVYMLIHQSPTLLEASSLDIGGDPVANTAWIFMGDLFSRYYRLPDLHFVADNQTKGKSPVEYSSQFGRFIYSSDSAPQKNSIAALEAGQIKTASALRFSTPSGKSAFAFNSERKQGWCLVAPTLFEVPMPGDSTSVLVSSSHTWAGGDGLTVHLSAKFDDGTLSELVSFFVPPLKFDDVPEWKSREVNIPAGAASIILSIQSDSGDASSDWVIFKNFSFKGTAP